MGLGSIGEYQILAELGRGGMGAVYRCLDPRTGRQVAVKVLAGRVAATEAQRRRFQRESLALAKIRHPNVLQVIGAGEVRGAPYLVTALYPGGSLSERLREGPLSIPEVVRLGQGLVAALQAAQGAGILHRDIKPDNVLYDEHDRPLLCDFGLAKDLTREAETQRLTKSGAMLGTPGYWSPEQAGGAGATLESDVFGLGATLYAALTGHAPFLGETVMEVMLATHQHLIRPLKEARPVPLDLEALVEACLARDPAARPSLGEIRERLQAVDVEARASRRTSRWGIVVVAGVAFAGGLGTTGWAHWSREAAPPSPAPPAEQERREEVTGSSPPARAAEPFLRRGSRPRLEAGGVAAGRFVLGAEVFATLGEVAGEEARVRFWDLGLGRELQAASASVPANEEGEDWLMVAPDRGEWIAWRHDALVLASAPTFQAPSLRQETYRFPGGARGPLHALQISAAGEVALGRGHAVERWRGGEALPLFRVATLERVKHLAFSPAGRSLAIGGPLQKPTVGYAIELRSYPEGRPLGGSRPAVFQRWPRHVFLLDDSEDPRLLVNDGLSLVRVGRGGPAPFGAVDIRGAGEPSHPSSTSRCAMLGREYALTLARPSPGEDSYDVALWSLEKTALVARFFESETPLYRDLDVDPSGTWVSLVRLDGGVEFWHRSRFLGR